MKQKKTWHLQSAFGHNFNPHFHARRNGFSAGQNLKKMENIQIGDKLIQYDNGFARQLFTVTRKTKTQLTAVADERAEYSVRIFEQHGGLKEIGRDSFSRISYKHATPEMLTQYHDRKKRADLIEKLQGANWSKYTTESLENIVKILNL